MDASLIESKAENISARVIAATGVIAGTVGAALVWYFDPAVTSMFPACPLYRLTGFACPGCGLTRGFHSLFHGDVLAALDYNALIPLWTVLFVYLFVSLVLTAIRGRGLPMKRIKPEMLWLLLALLLGFAVIRNIPYYPFSILFP